MTSTASPDLEERIVAAVAAVGPSVAAVQAVQPSRGRGRPGPTPVAATAFVLDPDGILVTNQHVVEQAREIVVHLPDGRSAPASVVGEDPVTDLAILNIRRPGLPPVRIGDSEDLHVGQIVLAVGHALGLPGSPTVSMGVVSALRRPLPGADFIFEGLLQTDAAINPGNSGGPVIDLDGAVIGVSTAVMPFAQGVGFAIPMHAVQRIAGELRARGRVVRPWIGASLAELGPEVAVPRGLEPHSGLLVVEVVARSPSHRAGILPGDILTRVGPFEVRRLRDLLEALPQFPIGGDVTVGYRRRGAALATAVPLQERPTSSLPNARS
jgi:serine protease Do